MIEKWKYVVGYEGLYEVSNFGRVRSLECKGKKRKTPLILSGREVCGYLQVKLRKDRKYKLLLIHRLVVEAFILGRKMKKGEVCDHINTVRHDNRVENLRVCSQKENCNNPLTRKKLSESTSKRMKGKTIRAIPITLRGVKDGSVYRFKSAREASRFFDYKNKKQIGNYISVARKNNKRTIKIKEEEFYFSQNF